MKLHFLVLFLICLLCALVITNGCHDDERQALLSFKSHLTDPSDLLASWHGQNCCNWYGVRCSDSLHVTSLHLRNPEPSDFFITMNSELLSTTNSSKALHGTISPALFTLKYLQHLDLSYNNFTFSRIPTGLANLKNLRYLNLSNAMFSGSITTQFSNLTSLIWLDISCVYAVTDLSSIHYNLSSSLEFYTGSLYAYIDLGNISSTNLYWLYGLPSLMKLDLSGVDLSKASESTEWLQPLSSLANLTFLRLSKCTIHGKIPATPFLNLTYLNYLKMDFNTFSSPIPSQLANLTSLEFLDLTHSSIHGQIPYFSQLKTLFVGNNPELIVDLKLMFATHWSWLERLDISSTKVIGPIPPSLGNTTSLLQFTADDCAISGPIPSTITNLSNLESLSLNFNKLSGHLSSSISNLKNLYSLSLMQNSFDGEFPDSICNMPSLQNLALLGNSLTGRLPDCITQLPNLLGFQVSINKMNGTISLTHLFQNSSFDRISLGSSGLTVKIDQQPLPSKFQPQVLELSECHLEGTFPDFISNLSQLTFLSLAYNSLTGPIPLWLFKLPKLGYLDLSFNKFSGVLPPSIRLRTYYGPRTLDLSNNHLQGSIDVLFGNVEAIDLSSNNLSGHIPLNIGVGNISYLSLSGNKLLGSIPPSLCHANSMLELLDLSNNFLSGRIPSSIKHCASLKFLSLSGNNLSGNFPDELEAANNLSYFDISENSFTGHFPNFIGKFRNLMVLNLGNNQLEGEIPRFIGDLQELKIIGLRSNFFNYSIPQEINLLKRLQYIDFSNNRLSGPIPPKLDGLEILKARPTDGNIVGYVISDIFAGVKLNIQTKNVSLSIEIVRTFISGIDLSHNMLTGGIPTGIGDLKGLAMLNLTHNHLSGKIPDSIGSMHGLESLDLSFNHLSGKIPIAMSSLDFLSVLNLSYNNLTGRIPTGPHFDTLKRMDWPLLEIDTYMVLQME
ncbi:putative Leucine-rich repeat receptor protein kinase EXS [Quillaja saponaria]|uniref:Leucine-rich repeat receptor protein kinase EXS n=1 Tax=Quillaja saponaria TaxID=32244 RepID=A0AAD7P5I3_QUISA|nr:putative Leucine-rich repeat receptor protein kinase EXS [Quillaja saponaria]